MVLALLKELELPENTKLGNAEAGIVISYIGDCHDLNQVRDLFLKAAEATHEDDLPLTDDTADMIHRVITHFKST